jgi:hypothetical protein
MRCHGAKEKLIVNNTKTSRERRFLTNDKIRRQKSYSKILVDHARAANVGIALSYPLCPS